MNFYSKTLTLSVLSAAALMFSSCSNDVLDDVQRPGFEDDGTGMYITAAISLPVGGGKSQTDDTGDTNSNANPDSEIGYDYENDVRSMILVIATEDNGYISHTKVSGITQAPESQRADFDFTVTGKIKHADLVKAYDGGVLATNKNVHVFAFCNYTDDLLQKFNAGLTQGSTDWIDWTGEVIETASPAGHSPIISNTIWARRSFLMSNAEINTVQFPDDIKEWDNYADESTPFDMTATGKPIKVERTAARIDFRDGSEYAGTDTPNKYDLMIKVTAKDGEVVDEANLYSVQLTRMSLVNMSRNYFYLRRVAPTADAASTVLCGVETSTAGKTPWVVDTDWDLKKDQYSGGDLTKGFNFNCYKADAETFNREGWYTDNIKEVLKGSVDNWEGSKDNRYHIWRYVTENTIPEAENQVHQQSTGIIFKGAIIAGKDITKQYPGHEDAQDDPYVPAKVQEALAEAAKHTDASQYDYPTLYMYNQILYATPDEVVEYAVKEGDGSPLYMAADNILKNWVLVGNTYTYKGEGTETLNVKKYYYMLIHQGVVKDITYGNQDDIDAATYDVDFRLAANKDKDLEENFRLEAAQEPIGFTVYRASNEEDGEGWGYYCYYLYWIRHNDNLKDSHMGTMEFATVRNNVYKLAVTKISGLGHPRRAEYNPNKPDGPTPNEKESNYIRVNIDVLPWVVRVNDIHFQNGN